MIILGILLAVCGALFGISLLLLFAGSTGRTIGGRQHWY